MCAPSAVGSGATGSGNNAAKEEQQDEEGDWVWFDESWRRRRASYSDDGPGAGRVGRPPVNDTDRAPVVGQIVLQFFVVCSFWGSSWPRFSIQPVLPEKWNSS